MMKVQKLSGKVQKVAGPDVAAMSGKAFGVPAGKKRLSDDAVERGILIPMRGKPVLLELVTGRVLRCVFLGADKYNYGVLLANGARALLPKHGIVLVQPDLDAVAITDDN